MVVQVILEEQLLQILQQHYALDVKTLQKLNLGADLNASLFKATTAATAYFVKVKHAEYDVLALTVIKLLHDAQIKEIIFPLAATDGKLSQTINDQTIIVYPFIDGHDGFTQPLSKLQWVQFGKMLKQIHNLPIPAPIQQSLPKETYSAKWRDIVKSLPARLAAYKGNEKIVQEFSKYYLSKLDTINQLANTADQLCRRIQSNTNKFVLCHSDCHAGNILINSNGAMYLVDWDEPIMAPKERDLMFIGAGVGNVWNAATETAYFYEGYGNAEINKTTLSYYRHERIIEDIAVYALDILSTTQDNNAKSTSFNYFKSQFTANGVIDNA